MADSKKYNGSTWQHSLRKLTTATDTITTIPADIYADGTNATVGLKGNTVQNGTPTPDNPIMPEGTGDLETVGTKAGQYKIPISSASTTTPVYLGEVETTRKIRKYECTGQEDWLKSNTYIGSYYTYLSRVLPDAKPDQFPYCSHLGHNSGSYSYGNCKIDWNSLSLWMFDTNTSVEDFKAYLATQYAAGTPVTVWYILATPETGIVNEPLMKIGDYADTVSGITVPTITGKDTFDVETTLKPSEVELTYTGWHDATVKEWDGSQWNE